MIKNGSSSTILLGVICRIVTCNLKPSRPGLPFVFNQLHLSPSLSWSLAFLVCPALFPCSKHALPILLWQVHFVITLHEIFFSFVIGWHTCAYSPTSFIVHSPSALVPLLISRLSCSHLCSFTHHLVPRSLSDHPCISIPFLQKRFSELRRTCVKGGLHVLKSCKKYSTVVPSYALPWYFSKFVHEAFTPH